jgi:hypothetical protein
MAISFSSEGLSIVAFRGMRGTIQLARPVVERFVPLGGTKSYIQRIKTESVESQIELWNTFETIAVFKQQEANLKKFIGLPATIGVNEDYLIENCYLMDYTYVIKTGVGPKPYFVTYTATIYTDSTDYKADN